MKARAPFMLVLLLVICFSLAMHLTRRQDAEPATGGRSGSVLAMMLGDGRKMFANQIFAKADAYFHRGNYPSIFELNARSQENHMASESCEEDHDHSEHEHAGCSGCGHDHGKHDHDHHHDERDWIARFGERFHPAVHVHLGEGDEREMLPWVRLSVELDPHRVETYVVGAYWLRRLNRIPEAEQFLRDGLRANPQSYEILFELGRLFNESRQDPERARNVWKAALRRWQQQEAGKEEPDGVGLAQISVSLSRLEERAGNLDLAIQYLELATQGSPDPEALKKQIDELRQKRGS